MGYIEVLNESVMGRKLGEEGEMSEVRHIYISIVQRNCRGANEFAQGAQAVMRIIEQVDALAASIPPVENSASRFGNPAFRTFYDRLGEVRSVSSSSSSSIPLC
jgi:serine/threonine-protein phosphatase 2A activator